MVAILFGYFEVQALCFKDPYSTSNKQYGNVRNSNTAILKLHLSNPKMFRIDPKWWSPFYLVISMLKLTSPQMFSWNLAQVFSCEFCEISKNTFFTEHLGATAPEIFTRAFFKDHIQKQSPRFNVQKKCSYTFCKIHRKTAVPDVFL